MDTAITWLVERYGGSASAPEVLSGGAWSRAFGFELDGQRLVLRLGQHLEDYHKDEWAARLDGPDLPVPRVLEAGTTADGGAFAVSERCDGLWLEELDPAEFQAILPALLRALDAMRAYPVDKDERLSWQQDANSTWPEFLTGLLVDVPGERVSGWRGQLAASPLLDELFVRGEATLRGLLSYFPDLHHVLHLDLINKNVLVAEDASRLQGVFDWGCLCFGDFVYEAAGFSFWASWYPGLDAIDFRNVFASHWAATGVKVPNCEERWVGYEIHIGLLHLAYGTFAGIPDDVILRIAARLESALDRLKQATPTV